MTDRPYYVISSSNPTEEPRANDSSWLLIAFIVIFLHAFLPWLSTFSTPPQKKQLKQKVTVQTIQLNPAVAMETLLSMQETQPTPIAAPIEPPSDPVAPSPPIPPPEPSTMPAPSEEILKKEEPLPPLAELPPPEKQQLPKPKPLPKIEKKPTPPIQKPPEKKPPAAPAKKTAKPTPVPEKKKPLPVKPLEPKVTQEAQQKLRNEQQAKEAEAKRKIEHDKREAEQKLKNEQAAKDAELKKKIAEQEAARKRQEALAAAEEKKRQQEAAEKAARDKAIVARLQESLAKNKESRDKDSIAASLDLTKTSIPTAITSLQIDALPDQNTGISWSAKEVNYRDEVAQRLKATLRLPDYGAVKIELTISKTGKVEKLKIISSESPKNKQYIERMIPTLLFPTFGNRFQDSPQCTFSITLNNEN